MKLKSIFCLVSLCCLFSLNANSAALGSAGDITLGWSDEPFEIPRGSGDGSRSATPAVPIYASQDGNQINLDFLVSVGEVEIVISQDGIPVYSSSENISFRSSKSIQLSQESGSFLLEIKGANGAYAYGSFTL